MQKNVMKIALIGSLMVPLAIQAAPVAIVTNGDDAGPGSLRQALADGATTIRIKPSVSEIAVDEPLVYDGTEPLKIVGTGQTIHWSLNVASDEDGPLLHVSQGADLTLTRLAFEGLGGYDIENQGGGKGVFVEVPADRQGEVKVYLTDVAVRDTGNHGVHIRDCEDDACGAGQGTSSNGSPASIYVRLRKVEIDGAGFGKQDADGLRVDDRGPGDITLVATSSSFSNVGGDGIELDEGDDGSVIAKVRRTRFYNNGAYCYDFDGELDPIALDPNCDDDGDPDVDDAFDIDEAGAGGIRGAISDIDVLNNYDEGLDFDTEGDGPDNFVDLDLVRVFASGNADEAVKVSEEGDASVEVRMALMDIGGDVEVEEEDAGDLAVILKRSTIGDDLKLSEEGPGVGTAKLRDTFVGDELDFNNVDPI
jgi:hypothetical protein